MVLPVLPRGGYAPKPQPINPAQEELAQRQAYALKQHEQYAQGLKQLQAQATTKQQDIDLTQRLIMAIDPTVDKAARKFLLSEVSQRVGVDPKGETSKNVQTMLLSLAPENAEQLRQALTAQTAQSQPGEINQMMRSVLSGQMSGYDMMKHVQQVASQTGTYEAAEAPGLVGSREARPMPEGAEAARTGMDMASQPATPSTQSMVQQASFNPPPPMPETGGSEPSTSGGNINAGTDPMAGSASLGESPSAQPQQFTPPQNIQTAQIMTGQSGTEKLPGQASGDTLGEARSTELTGQNKRELVGGGDTIANEGMQKFLGYNPREAFGNAFDEHVFKEPPGVQTKLLGALEKDAQNANAVNRAALTYKKLIEDHPEALTWIGTVSKYGSEAQAQLKAIFNLGFNGTEVDESKMYPWQRTAMAAGRIEAARSQLLLAAAGSLTKLSNEDRKIVEDQIKNSSDPVQALGTVKQLVERVNNDHTASVRGQTGSKDYILNMDGIPDQELQDIRTRGKNFLPDSVVEGAAPLQMGYRGMKDEPALASQPVKGPGFMDAAKDLLGVWGEAVVGSPAKPGAPAGGSSPAAGTSAQGTPQPATTPTGQPAASAAAAAPQAAPTGQRKEPGQQQGGRKEPEVDPERNPQKLREMIKEQLADAKRREKEHDERLKRAETRSDAQLALNKEAGARAQRGEERADREEARRDREEARKNRKEIQDLFTNLGTAIARSHGGSIHFPAVNLGGEQDASAFVWRPPRATKPPAVGGRSRSRGRSDD